MKKIVRVLFVLVVMAVGTVVTVWGGNQVLHGNWLSILLVIYGVGSTLAAWSVLRGGTWREFFENIANLFNF